MEKDICQKCNGKGQIKEADGTIHTCWDCLGSGEFDQHSKTVKDSGIQI
jgi:DnaJ-class molecular chaperone